MTNQLKKVLGKALVVCLAVAAFMAVASKSYAAPDPVRDEADATAVSAYVDGSSNLGVIMNVTYKGPNAHAYLAITASSATFWKDSGEATADTSIGGTSYGATGGTFDLTVSTMNTLGALCDAINASANYNCTLIGGLRADTDVGGHFLPIVGAATDINTAGGYNVNVGSNTILTVGFIPAAGRRVILKQCNVNSQGTKMAVYGRPRKYSGGVDFFGGAVNDNYLQWQQAITANTTANIPSATPVIRWSEFATNQGFSFKAPPSGTAYEGKVVVRADNYGTGSAAQTSANFISCLVDEK